VVTRGSYCLCVRVGEDSDIRIGALGTLRFQRGVYIYVGSAMSGLEPRLARHLRTSKGEGRVVKWHIDHLLSHHATRIESIYTMEGAVKRECEIAALVARAGEPVPRFGSSDCRCPSHLYRVEECGFLEKGGLKEMEIGAPLTSSSARL